MHNSSSNELCQCVFGLQKGSLKTQRPVLSGNSHKGTLISMHQNSTRTGDIQHKPHCSHNLGTVRCSYCLKKVLQQSRKI